MSKAIEAATEEWDDYVNSLPWWKKLIAGNHLKECKTYMLLGVSFGVAWEKARLDK